MEVFRPLIDANSIRLMSSIKYVYVLTVFILNALFRKSNPAEVGKMSTYKETNEPFRTFSDKIV